ncbi:MAG TPA: hypothetical protein VIU15_41410 [Streptomyces sp.]
MTTTSGTAPITPLTAAQKRIATHLVCGLTNNETAIEKHLAQNTVTREEIAGLVEGWELLGPGVAPVREWSPSLSPTDPRARCRASGYAVIARKL